MRGLGKLIAVEIKLFIREPAAFFFTLVFPLLLLVVFGSIFGNQPRPDWGMSFGYVDLYIPALAGLIIGTVALIGLPISTAANRESGVLRRYRATPLRPATFIASKVIVNFAMSLVGLLILVVSGQIVYGLEFQGSAPLFLAAFAFASLAFYSVGYLIAALSPTARVAQTVGMGLFFPMMFLSGAAMPRMIMPEKVRAVSDLLPLTHVVTLLQEIWFGEPLAGAAPAIAWLAVTLVVGAVPAFWLFRWE